MIKVVFTDLGNVVCPFDRARTKERFVELFPDLSRDYIIGSLYGQEAKDALYRFSIGKCSQTDYADTLERLLFGSYRADNKRLSNGVLLQATIAGFLEPNWRLIKRWKQLASTGIRIIALSDITPEHLGWVIGATQIEFDGLITSYEVGVCKPDARMWHAAMAFARADPEDCLYVDDLSVNVRGFVDTYGVHGHVYDLARHEDLEILLIQLGLSPCPHNI